MNSGGTRTATSIVRARVIYIINEGNKENRNCTDSTCIDIDLAI